MTDLQDLKIVEGLNSLTNKYGDVEGIDTVVEALAQMYQLNKNLDLAEDDPEYGLTRDQVKQELAETYIELTPTVLGYLLLALQLLSTADNVFNKQKQILDESDSALFNFIDTFSQNYHNLMEYIGMSEEGLVETLEMMEDDEE